MSVGTFVFQLILPLLVLIWFAFYSAQSRVGLVLQILGTAIFLLALTSTAMWAIPVWWLPRVYLCLFALALWIVSTRRRNTLISHRSTGKREWATLVTGVILVCLGGYFLMISFSARKPPADVAIINLATPFDSGRYVAVQAGSKRLINEHLRTLDTNVPRYSNWRGQSYAIDFIGIGHWGFRASGLQPADPKEYAIFGAKVISPCAGTVLIAVDDRPDMMVPKMDVEHRLGNHVIIQCADAHIVLAHLRKGSVLVEAAATLELGQPIGEVGNSGASGEPHLHLHAQTPGKSSSAPISGEPLSITIDRRYLVRGDRIDAVKY